MDFNRFTEKLQEGVRAAQSLAARHGQQQLDVEHLLLALLEQEGGLAPSILAKAEVNLKALHQKLTAGAGEAAAGFRFGDGDGPDLRHLAAADAVESTPRTKPSG